MRSTRRQVLVLLVACPIIPLRAFACKCVPPQPFEELVAEATHIVQARVLKPRTVRNDSATLTDWLVLRSWKGSLGEGLTFVTTSDQDDCGVAFAQGAERLLFLIGDSPFSLSRCHKIIPIEKAKRVIGRLDHSFRGSRQ